ncbi:MAG: stage V sporulation protein AD [Oscillospiraceae bacterium]|nr:stage V sporulation protein AD [Oscillospiraceae bacterium]
MNQHVGTQSIAFAQPPVLCAAAAVGGKKEAEGPLAAYFDILSTDTKFRQKSWEKAESEMQKLALQTALEKAEMGRGDLDAVLAGDLLNQCIGSSFSMRNTGLPTLGLYGACSTMAEGLLVGAIAVSGGFLRSTAVLTSSHFASSERQYRYPLGYGGQRTPTAQWTVTGSGCAILKENGHGPRIPRATIGQIVDMGIKDQNNMGAAMAPAAYETIQAHLHDFSLSPTDYDLIVTGDLGKIGKSIVLDLFRRDGMAVDAVYDDCGTMIYDIARQDVHAGGSGCGCSGVVLSGYLLRLMEQKKLRKLLFCGTGALLSPTSTQQGESIPAVCHAVSILSEEVS